MLLHELAKLTKKRKRVGRGGGRGGTSGRGHDGQNVRTGDRQGHAFEGGQMPIVRRLPKRGFSNVRFQTPVEIINLAQLEAAFSGGEKVTRVELITKGLIKGIARAKVKVLGKGILTKCLQVHVDGCSASAAVAIKNVGGEVHIEQEK